MDIQYLPATPEDRQTLYRLNEALIRKYEDMASVDWEAISHFVRRKLELRLNEYSCIYCGGKKAGFFRFCRSGDDYELDDLYILPEFQNRGIGTGVLKKCIAEADGDIFLYVFSQNTGALRLYERMGFAVTSQVSPTRYRMVRTCQ